jgi:5-methylcytosine-specific restriction protein B
LINEEQFDSYKAAFTRFFPNCMGFDSIEYIEQERAYKQELHDIFTTELAENIKNLPQNREDQLEIADNTIALLKRPLRSANNKPQNLMGFRYWNFLTHLADEHRIAFIEKLRELLYTEPPLTDRIDQFITYLESVPHHPEWKYSRAAGRAIYSFFLFVDDPSQHMYLHTSMIQTALKSLVGDALPDHAGGIGYTKVLSLAGEIKARLEADGWSPKDMIDVHSFLWVKYGYQDETITEELEDDLPNAPKPPSRDDSMTGKGEHPLNLIMYGPPGTGKTYHTVNRAISILDPYIDQSDRSAMRKRFDELCHEGRIASVTFHQSFSYEDFVEGLKAVSEDGEIRYEIEDGVFKNICSIGQASIEKASTSTVDTSQKTVWKMSLGNTQGSDSDIYDHCIENNEIRLGYGKDIDFSDADSRQAVIEKFLEEGRELKDQDYRVTAVNAFRNQMNIGDLVVVSDGNKKFRAIGEISGKYQCKPDEALGHYGQTRAVVWHRVWDRSIPYSELLEKSFSQMTLYRLRPKVLRRDKLAQLLGSGKANPAEPCLRKGTPLCNGKYEIVHVGDDLIRVQVKNTGSRAFFDLDLLNELADYVRQGRISIDDIKQKKVFEKTDSSLEKYIVNGYPAIIADLVALLTASTNTKAETVDPDKSTKVLIIDEINRGNVASIFGELITLIEDSKRQGNVEASEVILPYSKDKFSVPNNLYIIGTMNTADRSLAVLDTALRRRFQFQSMPPNAELLSNIVIEGVDMANLLSTLNKRIELLYDRDHLIGHSFFMGLDNTCEIGDLRRIFEFNVIPTLEEYFFEDWTKIRQVLGDNLKQSQPQFLIPKFSEAEIENLVGEDASGEIGGDYYTRNEAALSAANAYIGIYEPE